MKKPILHIIVPCYNEQEVLPTTSVTLKNLMIKMINNNLINEESKIVFVNDGSKDKTWEIIAKLHEEDKIYQGIKLTRNKGHQNALLAGLTYSNNIADINVTIDADLQDDENTIEEMVKDYLDGSHIVYGVRSSRKKDSFFKRFTAQGFYKMMKWLGVDIIYNHADFRLMSKEATNCLLEFDEANLFLRGMVPLIGYKTSVVKYERKERTAGESKYPLKKMIAFALDGITSFSVKPLKFITRFGFFMFLVSFAFLIYCLVIYLLGKTVSGWTTLMGSIWLLGGIQLMMLGIVGEYIGKIYKETKHRPKFFIEDILNK